MVAFKHISVAALAADIAAATPVVVLDVRDPGSFSAGRIAGAVRLDNQSVPQFLQGADKDAKTVVCCYHGNSSQSAAQFLAEHGFTDAYSLDGGMAQWALSQPCDQD